MRSMKIILQLISLLFQVMVFAKPPKFDHQYLKLSKLYNSYVKLDLLEGLNVTGYASYIDYEGLFKFSRSELNTIRLGFETLSKNEFDNFNTNQKLSFLINAYNVFVLSLIVNHYPVSSIRKIFKFWRNPFELKMFKLLDEQVSLNEIRLDMIPRYSKDSSFIYLLEDSSIDPPYLNIRPVTENNIDELSNEYYGHFYGLMFRNENGYLVLPKTLEFNKQILKDKEGGYTEFLHLHLLPTHPLYKRLNSPHIINYYRWDLNDLKNLPPGAAIVN